MRKISAFVLLIVGTAGCYPRVFEEHLSGRVVDKSGRPISGATILFTVSKKCGSLGGGHAPLQSMTIGRTDSNGKFDTTSSGFGLLYKLVVFECSGFSKSLEICKDGKWAWVYSEWPARSRVDASGSYVFTPESDWPFTETSGKAKQICLTNSKDVQKAN